MQRRTAIVQGTPAARPVCDQAAQSLRAGQFLQRIWQRRDRRIGRAFIEAALVGAGQAGLCAPLPERAADDDRRIELRRHAVIGAIDPQRDRRVRGGGAGEGAIDLDAQGPAGESPTGEKSVGQGEIDQDRQLRAIFGNDGWTGSEQT